MFRQAGNQSLAGSGTHPVGYESPGSPQDAQKGRSHPPNGRRRALPKQGRRSEANASFTLTPHVQVLGSDARTPLEDFFSILLQHPLRRQHLPRQPLFQHRRLVQRFRRRFEDGFHDVMRVAAIHEIHMEIEPAMGDEGLKEVLEEA